MWENDHLICQRAPDCIKASYITVLITGPYLDDCQQQLARVQLEQQPHTGQQVHEASPVVLTSTVPVVLGSACAEETSQVQKQQLSQHESSQPC